MLVEAAFSLFYFIIQYFVSVSAAAAYFDAGARSWDTMTDFKLHPISISEINKTSWFYLK